MKKLYVPQNEVELAFVRSILDGEGIPYFVHNDHFGSLRIGPRIDLFNAKTFMVDDEHFYRASELISDYLQNIDVKQPDSSEVESEYSVLDKIRIIFEIILFGWIMPGKKWPKKKHDQ